MTIVDIHTHVYPPSYMELLRSRTIVPYIRSFPPDPSSRLIILPGEDSPDSGSTSRGRPIGADHYSIERKIAFMDAHGIDISVISLANPWLDFLDPSEAAQKTAEINNEMNATCLQYPGRLFAFGTLPLSASIEDIVGEVKRLHGLQCMRGVVMGTGGLGKGLDDERLDPVWEVLQESGMTVFLHPHYGLPAEVYGPRRAEYGHVLPLALGFPLETTITVSRMLLSGVFDRYTTLSILVAHSGGSLPFLAGRLESCIVHDEHLMKSSGDKVARRSVWDVLEKNILLDAVIYSAVGLKAAVAVAGADRVLFGTDHPFFPPLSAEDAEEEQKWLSVTSNYKAIESAFGDDDVKAQGILGGNAVKLLRLKL